MKFLFNILFGMAIIIAIAALSSYFMYNYLDEEQVLVPSATGLDPVVEKDLKKIKTQNALLEGFEKKKELIAYEVKLSETIEWDESWGELSIFRKTQRARFYGTGIFVCDLSNISNDDIKLNFYSKEIRVAIPMPEIKSITIDETLTEFEDVEKGWFRFGTIKLTQQQYAFIYNSVKQSMNKAMKDRSVVKKAEENAKESIAGIFEEILNSVGEDFTVIVFIKATG